MTKWMGPTEASREPRTFSACRPLAWIVVAFLGVLVIALVIIR